MEQELGGGGNKEMEPTSQDVLERQLDIARVESRRLDERKVVFGYSLSQPYTHNTRPHAPQPPLPRGIK